MSAAAPPPQPALRRTLGLHDAVLIGLGAMLGAGVFTAFSPAARAAGTNLLPALLLAAVVAYCNASSSAALAATHPESGGSYLYGRRQLGPVWGFLAGWGFVIGKTASCAAMALTAGEYAWPAHPHVVAVAAAAVMTGVNYLGISRTAAVNRVLVAVTVAVLLLVVAACTFGGEARAARLHGAGHGGAHGMLQAAALLFFAFAGYARIATLGEEVRDPGRTIPRAIPAALGLVVLLYAAVGLGVLAVLGAPAVAGAVAPLRDAVQAGSWHRLAPVVQVGAVTASLGVLLSAMAGVGRTTLAMARDRELPGVLAVVHPRFGVPHRAELALGCVVVAVVSVVDVRHAIGFSSVGVLVYYAVANASAWTLRRGSALVRRTVAAVGFVGCAALALSLPAASVSAGAAVLMAGLVGRAVVAARRSRG